VTIKINVRWVAMAAADVAAPLLTASLKQIELPTDFAKGDGTLTTGAE